MSGGVGPTSDISLPKEEEEQSLPQHPNSTTHPSLETLQKPRRGFFTFRQLNALAVMVVFAASGMVSVEDFAFVVFTLFYIYFLCRFAFPTLSRREPPVFGPNKLLGLYVFAAAVIGLYLPIAYIFQGVLEGDKEGIKAAAPHVFLLASQIFMEGLSASDRFSTPIRVFVPVFYNSRRLLTLMEWLRSEITKVDGEFGGSARRVFVGRALAVANMAFWSFNLLAFLLPVYLPRAFKIYYSDQKVNKD